MVGAGPGDPDLLTIKAVKAIRSASVLFVDDLVGEAVLQHAQAGARIVRVGKRGGCKSTPQSFIEKLMIVAVRQGETVVRLKGGDPFVFGRGGEEVQHLRDAGIACEVVNGITSGLAAATALVVPWTHRDHAQGVLLVTGHAREGKDGQDGQDGATDWPALAAAAHAARLTIVIYMGVAGAAHIQQGLLAGLPGSTPVAAVQNASLTSQQHVLTTLANLHADLADSGLGSPAIIVVGDVLRGLAAATADGQAAWPADSQAAWPAAGGAARAQTPHAPMPMPMPMPMPVRVPMPVPVPMPMPKPAHAPIHARVHAPAPIHAQVHAPLHVALRTPAVRSRSA